MQARKPPLQSSGKTVPDCPVVRVQTTNPLPEIVCARVVVFSVTKALLYDDMTRMRKRAGKLNGLRAWLLARSKPGLGAWGEWIALYYLRRLGWDILARNYRLGQGELDIIAYDGAQLVIIEVKTRRRNSLLPPETGLDSRKLAQMEHLAMKLLQRSELDPGVLRFDLIAVETADRRRYWLRHYSGVA